MAARALVKVVEYDLLLLKSSHGDKTLRTICQKVRYRLCVSTLVQFWFVSNIASAL